MCETLYEWLDELFYNLEKKYPYKQSYKVTPEYILDRKAKLPHYWEYNRLREKYIKNKNKRAPSAR